MRLLRTPSWLVLLGIFCGCTSRQLIQHAAWQLVQLQQPQTPLQLQSVPYLRDLPENAEQRAQMLRRRGAKLGFSTYPNGGVAELRTTAFAAFTDTHLVALLEGVQSPDYALRANPQEQEDGHIWNDDNFEIFVDPFLSRSDYIHFIVNPIGDVFDARCYEKRIPDPKAADPAETIVELRKDVSYSSGASVPVVKSPGQWGALFHLPFSGFGLRSAPMGQVWGLNLCHTNRENGELSQWQPTPGSKGFHQPRRFGAIRFGDADNRFDSEFELPLFGFGGNVVAMATTNRGPASQATSHLTVTDEAGKTIVESSETLRLASGHSEHQLRFQMPLTARGRCRLAIEVRAADQTVGYLVRNLAVPDPLVLTVPLTQVYSSDPFIEGLLRLGAGMGELGSGGRPLRLALRGPGGVRTRSFPTPAGNILSFRLSIDGLEPGTYSLEADYAGQASARQQITIIAAPFPFRS